MGKNTNVLKSYRNAIDELDTELLALLNARARIISELASVKKICGLPVYDRQREYEVLQHVSLKNSGPLDRTSVVTIFRCIIRESRRLENEFTKVLNAKPRKEVGTNGHQYGAKRIRG